MKRSVLLHETKTPA